MTRLFTTVFVSLVAASLGGCLDRGGLDPLDGGDAVPDVGGGTGGKSDGTGGTTAGTGGAAAGSGGMGSTGSGGLSGTGAMTASGGTTGSGGLVGSGGVLGSGGWTGTGGIAGSGSGGTTGTGGIRGSGGVTGTGGLKGTGGATMCPPVCDVYCPHGNVVDAKGCTTCSCKPATCTPIVCGVMCTHGYVKDANGCDTCACVQETKSCTAEECGARPSEPALIACPAGTASPPPAQADADKADADKADRIVAPALPLVCQRNALGKCVWQKGGCRTCAPVTCLLACPNGFQIGTDGCQICACKP